MLLEVALTKCKEWYLYNDKSERVISFQYKHFVNPCSAGTVISRQNLTSVDVTFWRLMAVPAL